MGLPPVTHAEVAKLYEEHSGRIRRFAVSLVGEQDADDVAGAAWEAILKKTPTGKPLAYLHGCARMAAREVYAARANLAKKRGALAAGEAISGARDCFHCGRTAATSRRDKDGRYLCEMHYQRQRYGMRMDAPFRPWKVLTDREVEDIRIARKAGKTVYAIAAQHNIGPGSVSRICLGRSRGGPVAAPKYVWMPPEVVGRLAVLSRLGYSSYWMAKHGVPYSQQGIDKALRRHFAGRHDPRVRAARSGA